MEADTEELERSSAVVRSKFIAMNVSGPEYRLPS